jgi:hypothetical protein
MLCVSCAHVVRISRVRGVRRTLDLAFRARIACFGSARLAVDAFSARASAMTPVHAVRIPDSSLAHAVRMWCVCRWRPACGQCACVVSASLVSCMGIKTQYIVGSSDEDLYF